jgi:hypothetical protein
MSVFIEPGFTGSVAPINNPRIGAFPASGTVTATSEAVGFEAANAASDLTYRAWRPTALPATWTQTFASAQSVSYVGLAAHNLASRGNRVTIQTQGAVSRTNLALRSQDFANSYWSKAQATIGTTPFADPTGGTAARAMIETTAAGLHSVARFISGLTAGAVHSWSIFVKAAGRTRGRLMISGSTGTCIADFDLAAGTVTASNSGSATGTTARIVAFGGGWYRVAVSGVATAADTGFNVTLRLADANGAQSYTGDGVSGMILWGAQFEQSPEATGYIPTVATTAASDWYDVTSWLAPDDDQPLFALFAPRQALAVRVIVTQGTAPDIGIIRCGLATEFPRPSAYVGRQDYNDLIQDEFRANESEGGHVLGRYVVRRSQPVSLAVAHLSEAWKASTLDPLIDHMRTRPVFVADRPFTAPRSVAFGYATGKPVPTRDIPNSDVSVSVAMEFSGHVA